MSTRCGPELIWTRGDAYALPEPSKELVGQRLGYSICQVVMCGNMGELNCVVKHLLSEEVLSDVDVLGAIMWHRVLGQQDGGVVVVEDR